MGTYHFKRPEGVKKECNRRSYESTLRFKLLVLVAAPRRLLRRGLKLKQFATTLAVGTLNQSTVAYPSERFQLCVSRLFICFRGALVDFGSTMGLFYFPATCCKAVYEKIGQIERSIRYELSTRLIGLWTTALGADLLLPYQNPFIDGLLSMPTHTCVS